MRRGDVQCLTSVGVTADAKDKITSKMTLPRICCCDTGTVRPVCPQAADQWIRHFDHFNSMQSRSILFLKASAILIISTPCRAENSKPFWSENPNQVTKLLTFSQPATGMAISLFLPPAALSLMIKQADDPTHTWIAPLAQQTYSRLQSLYTYPRSKQGV
ncbi:hypothetical protein RRG08_047665 [Elysia crispata]|uniref:Uncharacterized protein n=1 Tax=Elysia crispata TaxID=231223 RepID=A0AAE1EDP1_9GAST|nr:hypothetical protein RRG08_047665 [Elysia crispata]